MKNIEIYVDGELMTVSQKTLNQIKKELKSNSLWSVDEGGYYYALEYDGNIAKSYHSGEDYNYNDDYQCIMFSNKTKAKLEMKKDLLRRKLQRFSDEHDGEKISWNNNDGKWSLYLQNNAYAPIYTMSVKELHHVYFYTKKIALQSLNDNMELINEITELENEVLREQSN